MNEPLYSISEVAIFCLAAFTFGGCGAYGLFTREFSRMSNIAERAIALLEARSATDGRQPDRLD
jgi:hypothetical protein